MRAVLLSIFILFMISCSKDVCRDTRPATPVQLEAVRMEQKYFNASSAREIEAFLAEDKGFARYMLRNDQFPHDSIISRRYYNLIRHHSIDTLYQETVAAFSTDKFDQLIQELEEGYGRMKAYYPETRVPKLKTIVTGLGEDADLFISDTLVIVGLDYFIGEQATYQPQQIPYYIFRRYNQQHLPAIILQFASSRYVLSGKTQTLLSDMINYGKGLYFLSKLMPCAAGNILIGYTETEWGDIYENEDIIWANFIQNEWLYETNHIVKQKFLGERPNVYEISEKCPGRIGAWLGWRIVEAYMKNTDTPVEDLLKETDHHKIFTQSRYKPSS